MSEVIETMRDCGYQDWQIARGLVALERGATAHEARVEMDTLPESVQLVDDLARAVAEATGRADVPMVEVAA